MRQGVIFPHVETVMLLVPAKDVLREELGSVKGNSKLSPDGIHQLYN